LRAKLERNFPGEKILSDETITRLLSEWSEGNEAARDELIPLVAGELRRIAGRHLAGERREHTLQATALINEAYLRLVEQRGVQWQGRSHFFAIAAQLMRRILVDYARAHKAAKRNCGHEKISLDDVIELGASEDRDLVALDNALAALTEIDARRAHIVELRFFGGLTIEETAEALNVSGDVVKAEWRLAKAWLYREMSKQ
jgi:RNA polymerase sigma-70 factor, ECF subfamily